MSRHRTLATTTAVAVLAGAVVALPVTATASAPAPPAAEDAKPWTTTDVPVRYAGLSEVAAADGKAVTVGFQITPSFVFRPLALRWDGERWERQPVRGSRQLGDARFDAVDLQGPDRGWAVGSASGPMAARWDGSRWKARSIPVDGDVALLGVDAVGRKDVWAAGQEQVGSTLRPFLLHRTGGGDWQEADLPDLEDVGPFTALTSVSAESRSSVWAAGLGGACLRWDGEAWEQVHLPKVDGLRIEAQQVRAFGADDVWVVGYVATDDGRRPAAMHWDGQDWTVADTPEDGEAQLNDVVQTAGGGVVAVGYAEGPLEFYGVRLRLDGPATPISLPEGGDIFTGAATDPSTGELWVVGSYDAGSGFISPYAAVRR